MLVPIFTCKKRFVGPFGIDSHALLQIKLNCLDSHDEMNERKCDLARK